MISENCYTMLCQIAVGTQNWGQWTHCGLMVPYGGIDMLVNKSLVKVQFSRLELFNTLRPGKNGRHFADDIFKCIFLNENAWIPTKISLKFVPQGPINNIPALVQIMAWRRPGDKPLSEPMMASLPTHICVTRPQWVKEINLYYWLRRILPAKKL